MEQYSSVANASPSLESNCDLERHRNEAAYEFVKLVGRLQHDQDEDYCGSDDFDDDHEALNRLIAKARDIMSMPLRQVLGDALTAAKGSQYLSSDGEGEPQAKATEPKPHPSPSSGGEKP